MRPRDHVNQSYVRPIQTETIRAPGLAVQLLPYCCLWRALLFVCLNSPAIPTYLWRENKKVGVGRADNVLFSSRPSPTKLSCVYASCKTKHLYGWLFCSVVPTTDRHDLFWYKYKNKEAKCEGTNVDFKTEKKHVALHIMMHETMENSSVWQFKIFVKIILVYINIFYLIFHALWWI